MREEFPIFRNHPNLCYLDSAATAHKPDAVIHALKEFYEKDYGTVHRAIYRQSLRATEKYAEAREKVCFFLNANSSQEIIFTKGTTDSLNIVATSLTKTFLKPGDEILVSEMEHHSNLVPWQMAAKECGATLSFIPMNEQGVLEWEGKITSKTKIVAVAHMSNVTGTMNPIAPISQEAKKVGAFLVVDGAQAAPHMPVDVQKLGCDFYAFSSHKCYGPTGIGVLFGKKELLEVMTPIQGGGDMILRVDLMETTYAPPPLRFEAGTPLIAQAIGFKAALDWIDNVTRSHLYAHTHALRTYTEEKLNEIPGLHILGQAPEKGGLITFTVDGAHPLDIATLLDAEEIAIRSGHLCAQPLLRKFGLESALRVSFAAYNTEADAERFVKALKRIIPLMSRKKNSVY